jgi:hypothetical protein
MREKNSVRRLLHATPYLVIAFFTAVQSEFSDGAKVSSYIVLAALAVLNTLAEARAAVRSMCVILAVLGVSLQVDRETFALTPASRTSETSTQARVATPGTGIR